MSRLTLLTAGLCLAVFVASASAQSPTAQAPAAQPKAPAAKAPAAPAPVPLGAAKTMLTTKEVMKHVTNPAAETYWGLSGEVDTEAGAQSRAPKDDEHWITATNAAAIVQESGNMLMLTGRARDDRWMIYAQQMADAGAAGVKAAAAHDPAAMFEAGSKMYDACFNCHGRYIPRPANSLYNAPLYKEP